ncbi:HNH endonuclease signature motif containing protein [Mycobacterium camsae]|uniref:HNH endonuclease signature motif containing protein n=1 Tax=Mycobacterium gordonae TaxID=1778 RepID=UPI00197D2F13|nr:HNH endonuclease signature motif containing protein [Mycobacterium gordonae]
MAASTREEIVEVFNALDAELDRLCGLTFDAFTTPEWMRGMERLEKVARRLRTPQHALITHLGAATIEELGAALPAALADRLRITKAEANRRIAEAEELGQRRTLTGEPLAPKLAATAAAQREGRIGDGHVKVIRSFIAHLPSTIDMGTWEAAEKDLAGKACDFRPDQVAKYAHELMELLHPDGDYTEEERARTRGLALGPQQYDGMSRISGLITPELRALIEAAWAKLAAPGTANPDGERAPDTRSQPQRNHDGMVTAIRELFASGELGTHKGLPVSIIVTTTLKDLEAGAGKVRTAGGTRVPVTDLIRWAATSHHYLAVFDQAKPLALFHTKRFANLAQRMMLIAKEGGCTRPGCTAPAYHAEVHHVSGWTHSFYTDIHDLTLACGPDNRLAEKGWTTRKNAQGDTQWIPPAHLDHGQPRVNTFHHPEKLFAPEDDEPV